MSSRLLSLYVEFYQDEEENDKIIDRMLNPVYTTSEDGHIVITKGGGLHELTDLYEDMAEGDPEEFLNQLEADRACAEAYNAPSGYEGYRLFNVCGLRACAVIEHTHTPPAYSHEVSHDHFIYSTGIYPLYGDPSTCYTDGLDEGRIHEEVREVLRTLKALKVEVGEDAFCDILGFSSIKVNEDYTLDKNMEEF
jgi:hypothetical protein